MKFGSSEIELTVSQANPDDLWDQFLSASTSGQFQQSSLWARAKAAEHWECARLLARSNGQLIGGAQLLHRSSRLGRIGYVSKGPVLANGAEDLFLGVLDALHSLCRDLRLRAWIVQPPDDAFWQTPLLYRAGYLPAYPFRIIDANLVLNLCQSWDIIYGNMNRSTRQKAQQAKHRGIRIRVGTEADIGIFFDLMSKTCQRQRTKPHPGSVSSLIEIWRAFMPSDRVRLFFAEIENVKVAGLFCLIFGGRVTLWKKGWNSDPGQPHPNEFLHLETIRWAWESGYDCCDFMALDRGIAETIIAGKALSHEQKRSRHLFNIKMGAMPVLLPSAALFVADPFARGLYRGVGKIPILAKAMKRIPLGVG